jgi:hypothetical protein
MPSSNLPRVLKKKPQIVVVSALSRVDRDQLSIAILCDFIALTRQHSCGRRQPKKYSLLSGTAIVVFGKCGKFFDDGMEYRVDWQWSVQVVDITDGFEAFTERRQYVDVLMMRLRDI